LRYYIEITVAENAVGYSICSFIECAATQFNYMDILSQPASIAPTGCHCPCRCHCHHRLHYRHRRCRGLEGSGLRDARQVLVAKQGEGSSSCTTRKGSRFWLYDNNCSLRPRPCPRLGVAVAVAILVPVPVPVPVHGLLPVGALPSHTHYTPPPPVTAQTSV
jgi:hypothetical protein